MVNKPTIRKQHGVVVVSLFNNTYERKDLANTDLAEVSTIEYRDFYISEKFK